MFKEKWVMTGFSYFYKAVCCLWVGACVFLLWPPDACWGRVLNLSGSLEWIYSTSWTDQNGQESRTQTFQQRYNLGNVGDIWDPRLGTYTFNATFLDLNTHGAGTESDLEVLDFNVSANLLPRALPLTVYAQRVHSDRKTFPTSNDTRSTYGLNWVFPLRNLPTLRLNLQQTELESDFAPDSTTRYVNLSGDGKVRRLNIRANAQYTDVEVEGNASNESYGLNLNMDGPIDLTETVTMNAFATYANRGGTPVGGVGTFQERGAGISFFHRPSLSFNQNTSYSFFDTPSNVSFQRHIFTYGLNWRPSGKVDLGGNYRLLRFEIDQIEVNSHFLSLHGSVRPVFGLNISPNLSGGITETKGGGQADVRFVRMSLVVNYIRNILDRVRWSSGVTAGPGVNWTGSSKTTRTWDLPITISTTLDNLDTRFVYMALTYVYHFIRVEEAGTKTDTSRDHRIQFSANSRYFRNLLYQGDNLFLEFLTSYTDRTGGISTESSILVDSRATYYLPMGFNVKTGTNHLDQSGTPGQVTETVFGELQWVTVLWRSLSVVSSVRETWQFNEYAEDVETLSGHATLGYQLGRLSMSVQYSIYRNETDFSDVLNQSVYVRASRPF